MTPSGIYDLLASVLSCVCDQMDAIAATDYLGYPGCPCLSYISPGEPAIDCCSAGCEDGGMLTVHVESVFPSTDFPLPDQTFQPCKAATWVATVVVTASRCVVTTDEQGNLVPAEILSAAGRVQAIDHYAVLTALGCCVVADPPGNKRIRRVQIQQSQSNVSDGGCGSIEVRALIEAGPICSCASPVS